MSEEEKKVKKEKKSRKKSGSKSLKKMTSNESVEGEKMTVEVKETEEENKIQEQKSTESISEKELKKEEDSETQLSVTTSPSTETISISEFGPEEVIDADHLIDKAPEEIKDSVENVPLKESKKKKQMRKLKSTKKLEVEEEEEGEDFNPWFKMRECLLLNLQARLLLKSMIHMKLKEERIREGALSVNEIQNLLRSQKEEQETDWITEIQELKRNLVSEIRRNHVLERDLNKLDKRIALLIKNRGNIDELEKGKSSDKKKAVQQRTTSSEIGTRKMEHYQNLFYLLQTEPKYLANLVYLMQPEQMEAFLDTVILTLFGDAFSPREEFLILRLFQLSIEKEMSVIKNVSDFLKADSVVPKMVIAYNRRKQGSEFLKSVLGPLLKNFITKDLNLELKPQNIYQAMINDREIDSGQKSTLDRNLPEEKILEIPEIQSTIESRVKELEEICQQFFDGITDNLNKVPYGIRWICKQIRSIAQDLLAEAADEDILKVTGYFVYYRFINLAIVTPDAFEIITQELTPVMRKNLVAVAKVLQNLFNFSTFTPNDKSMMVMNPWINKNIEAVRDYFTDLIEVAEPDEYLQVDRYMELTQKTKPIIIISLKEITATHSFLQQNIHKLCKEADDPLRLILTDLGDPPQIAEEDNREIQLTLTNRFKQNMEEEISSSASLYAETKELVINTFRLIPVQGTDTEQTLVSILNYGKQHAEENKNTALETNINKIFENIKSLEAEGLITKEDNYSSFLRDIALEVANRAEIREQQRKEIKRLTQTLRNLRKHQKYLTDQTHQYNDYLQKCRQNQAGKSKKKKKSKKGENPNKIGPFEFSYQKLQSKGVIIDSDVPHDMIKKTKFVISSEEVGVFDIVAKIGHLPVEKKTLELDDLLERNYNNITRLELNEVTLDVNMMIHLLNKFFLGKAKK